MKKVNLKKILPYLIIVLILLINIDVVSAATVKVTCGNITGIPKKIPILISDIIKIVQVVVPIILIIMGSLDLFKGITAQKEDEMKKGQQLFIKRLILGAIIFFVVVIVKFIISLVADTSSSNIVECIDCFISGECKEE